MNLPRKRMTGLTAIKYFLSYLIIFTVLIVGFFFITKKQITDNYFEYRSDQALTQLDHLATQFHEELVYLSRIDSEIVSDLELIEGRYKEADGYSYHSLTELREYCATAKLISSIVYLPKKTNLPLSTHLPVTYLDGLFYITNSAMKTVVFDPEPWLGASYGQLVYVSNEDLQYLIYVPAINRQANYIFFYILDTTELQQRFKGTISEEILSVALVDENQKIVMGVNSHRMEPCLEGERLEDGVHQKDNSTFLCIRSGINRRFSMAALLSRDFLTERINESFAGSYLALLLLSLLGFLLVLLAMRITYLPLHRLTQRIVPDADARKGYLHQLESAFSEAESRNQLLQGKLENYRISLQKSLLDSIVIPQSPGVDIDQLFNRSKGSELFVLRLSWPEKELLAEELRRRLESCLPEGGACILLVYSEERSVFLVNYTGTTSDKAAALKSLCDGLHRETGCLCAISNGSESPLDIPSLYENARYAASFWPRLPVAEFQSLPPVSSGFQYPHDRLNRFSELLNGQNFADARQEMETLLGITNRYISEEGNLAHFFVQCILIDILTLLTNYMNLAYIKFYDYSDLYFETLYYCRSCPYREKAREIQQNMGKLMDFCEQTITEKTITSAPLIQIVEESYCQPEFSISALADRFHVSVAYMSSLFKKELNVNFSDYLWAMRQKKAQELLRTTEMSIDEISIAVGYINTSSFRRKFKQETGLTPSQYRSSNETGSDNQS